MKTTIPNPDISGGTKFQLGNSWNLYESYQSSSVKTSHNFSNNNNMILEFSDLETLASVWNNTQYAHPGNMFYDDVNHNVRKFKVNDSDQEERVIDALLLFKKNIRPEWEDPMNQNGCSFECTLHSLSPEKIDQIWQNLLTGLISENFPFIDFITGIRFMDRLKKFGNVKIEIWMTVGLNPARLSDLDLHKNGLIVDAIVDYFVDVINRTTELNKVELTKKEHEIRRKVN